jgi:hypothetical protein
MASLAYRSRVTNNRNMDSDILVWELVSVRCGLAQTTDEDVRRTLRKQERALVGALLDLGVLGEPTIAPLPAHVETQPPLF